MSYVTNVICAYEAGDPFAVLEEINACIPDDRGRLVHVGDPALPPHWFANGKTLEVEVAIGAFNYLDVAGWVEELRRLDWEALDARFVQLMVQQQEDWGFGIIDVWRRPGIGEPFDPRRVEGGAGDAAPGEGTEGA